MLTSEEKSVYEYLPIGRERSKTSDYFKMKLGINRRALCDIVESLRTKGYAIGSIRGRDGGYYLINNQEDLDNTLKVYDAQISTMMKTRAKLKNARLAG